MYPCMLPPTNQDQYMQEVIQVLDLFLQSPSNPVQSFPTSLRYDIIVYVKLIYYVIKLGLSVLPFLNRKFKQQKLTNKDIISTKGFGEVLIALQNVSLLQYTPHDLYNTTHTSNEIDTLLLTLMKVEAFFLQSFSSSTAKSFLDWSSLYLLEIHQNIIMRLIVGKIAICLYLLYLAYGHHKDQILGKVTKQMLKQNIDGLNISKTFKQFLELHLLNFIYFNFYVSPLTVLSRSIFPKIFNATGLALWIYFTTHPQMIIQSWLQQILEEVCIIGGLLFIAGCEYLPNYDLQERQQSEQKKEG